MLRYVRALPALLAFGLVAAAPGNTDGTMTVRSDSKLWVDGTSTVRSFSCAASSFDAQITARDAAAAEVLGGVKAVQTVDVTLPISALDCKNGTMNEHMRKALKAEQHPTISFALNSYDLVQSGDSVRATLNGTLTMGGVEKPVVFDAELSAAEDGVLEVAGTIDLNMKEFGLKPPSLMLGTMKVRENVKVRFEMYLQQ